jgi:hypothetical protein
VLCSAVLCRAVDVPLCAVFANQCGVLCCAGLYSCPLRYAILVLCSACIALRCCAVLSVGNMQAHAPWLGLC